jgi:hypothetical protein
LALFPFRDFYINVVVYNQDRGAVEFMSRGNPIKDFFASFFYPIYSFFVGKVSLLRFILVLLSVSFIGVIFNLFRKKEFKAIVFILITLGLANIRYEIPGFMFFQAFHMTVWYALFIFTIGYYVLKLTKPFNLILLIPIAAALMISIISPESFLRVYKAKVLEFNNNYLREYIYSTAIKALSRPDQTIFVDGRDELILALSDRNSSYKYYWYTAFMPSIPLYIDARKEMFKKNPPDFYYDACFYLKKEEFNYQRLMIEGKPSCLLVKKTLLPGISKDQIDSIRSLGFSLK